MAEQMVKRAPQAPFSMSGVVGQSRDWATALPTPGGMATADMNTNLRNSIAASARLAAIERSIIEKRSETQEHQIQMRHSQGMEGIAQARENMEGDNLDKFSRYAVGAITVLEAANSIAKKAGGYDPENDAWKNEKLEKVSSFLEKFPGVGTNSEDRTTAVLRKRFLDGMKSQSAELVDLLNEASSSIASIRESLSIDGAGISDEDDETLSGIADAISALQEMSIGGEDWDD